MFNQPHIDFFDLPCERLPRAFDGFTVLHLSDLHMTRWTRLLEKWRGEFSRLSPDLLAITGDLGHRSWHWKATLESALRLLEPLTPRFGTYFILGNHDSVKLGPALAETKDARGMPRVLLQNQTVFLRAGETGGVQVEKDERRKTKVQGGWRSWGFISTGASTRTFPRRCETSPRPTSN